MANKNAWFKHYNTASQGHTLGVLWSNGDTEAIALFWLILELVSRFESDISRGEITISWNTIGRETGWKPTKCRRVLARISPVSKIEINEKEDGYVSFLVPNWLELQENRGGKREAKKEQKPDRREKREVRSKNKEIDTEILAFIDHWNSQNWDLPKVSSVTKTRQAKIKCRLKEAPLTDWFIAISLIHESPFLLGRISDWKASFDWLIGNQENRIKIMEGKYKPSLPVNSESKTRDWLGTADRIWTLCLQNEFSLSERMRGLLGSDLVDVVKATGPLYDLRQQQKNDFTLKSFASRLKAAHESLAQKGA